MKHRVLLAREHVRGIQFTRLRLRNIAREVNSVRLHNNHKFRIHSIPREHVSASSNNLRREGICDVITDYVSQNAIHIGLGTFRS
jgi:hypothetical protein